MARQSPERVRAIVLVCPVIPGERPSRRATVRAVLDGRTAWVEQRAQRRELPALELPPPAAPCTVVIGTHDDVIDPAAARRYATSIGAHFVEVADAGHLLPMQRPAEVARAIAAATSGSRGDR
jgi:pimeloyl-ACP methyl ester carboxylesterase